MFREIFLLSSTIIEILILFYNVLILSIIGYVYYKVLNIDRMIRVEMYLCSILVSCHWDESLMSNDILIFRVNYYRVILNELPLIVYFKIKLHNFSFAMSNLKYCYKNTGHSMNNAFLSVACICCCLYILNPALK